MKDEKLVQAYEKIEPNDLEKERMFRTILKQSESQESERGRGKIMKKKWKVPSIVAACVLVLVIIVPIAINNGVGAGSGSGGASTGASMDTAQNSSMPSLDAGAGASADDGSLDMAMPEEEAAEGEVHYEADQTSGGQSGSGDMGVVPPIAPIPGPEDAAPSGTPKKIIRNANIEMEAVNVRQAYAEILNFARGLDGYEFSQSTNTSGEYTNLNAQIRIPSEHLDALMEFMDGYGEASIIGMNIQSDDITDQFYDTELRLNTQRATLEQYFQFLSEAQDVEEILMVQRTIDQITMEIESMEGMMRVWQQQVSESTVNISIYQKGDPIVVSRDVAWNTLSVSAMGALIRNGLVTMGNVVVSILQWIAIVLIVLSPLIVIGLVVFFIVRKRRRKKDPV